MLVAYSSNPMRFKSTIIYLITAVLSLIITGYILQLWKADLNVPFSYEWKDIKIGGNALDPIGSNDAILFYCLFKGICENGWYLHNPNVGMPAGLDMHDYPMADTLQFAIVKVIGYFTSNYAAAANVYFLLGFPLVAMAALYTFKELKISNFVALIGSLLFTFIPYHFIRGEQHLFLASYYLVPLMVTVIFWSINEERLFVFLQQSNWLPCGVTSKGWISFLICVLIGSGGVYYALFGVFFLVVGAVIFHRNWKTLFPSLFLTGTIFLTLIVNIIPTLIFVAANGRNNLVADHLKADGEIYGLKIIQMLLPVMHHRFDAFSKFSSYYYTHAPLVTENVSASLGGVASIGFLILIFWQLGLRWRTQKDRLLTQLSTLNLASILLATVGGLSSLICFGISPLVRCFNRMSVFIALFSLLAVAINIEQFRLADKIKQGWKFVWFISVFLILFFGLFDQTTDFFIPPYVQSAASFENDKNFVHRIESMLPAGAMVFELPYIPFPEGRPGGLSLFRPYLHSHQLRWSYGSLPGRAGDEWIRKVAFADTDLSHILQRIKAKGFMGIYIDRELMPEYSQVEDALTKMLNTHPIESENHRQTFFSLIPSSN